MKAYKKSLLIFMSIIALLLSLTPLSGAYILGDIDENSIVDSTDARTALRASVNLDKLDTRQYSIADIDKDGTVTASDARIILRTSVGLETIKTETETSEEIAYEIHFIDVGQADCALIISGKDSMLIDGGNTSDSQLIIDYLFSEGITELDYVICTHAHEDHVGGLGDILDIFTVTKTVFAPETGSSTKCYGNFLEAVGNQNMTITTPEIGYSFDFGDGTVLFAGPVTESYSDLNNTSLVTKITFGETSFLFTGDAERESEADIINYGIQLGVTVLKVGHHGSENSTSYPFLREIMPEIAIISVGADNDYGHPTDAVLSRLRDADVKVYRTDMQGHIVISGNGSNYTVTTEKNSDAQTNPTIPPSSSGVFIGNKNSKILHTETCSSLPKEANRVYFNSKDTALSQGYTPCSKCSP